MTATSLVFMDQLLNEIDLFIFCQSYHIWRICYDWHLVTVGRELIVLWLCRRMVHWLLGTYGKLHPCTVRRESVMETARLS